MDGGAKVFELDQLRDGRAWSAYLHQLSGQRTVPSIWIGGKFVGGNSDLQLLAMEGELRERLEYVLRPSFESVLVTGS